MEMRKMMDAWTFLASSFFVVQASDVHSSHPPIHRLVHNEETLRSRLMMVEGDEDGRLLLAK